MSDLFTIDCHACGAKNTIDTETIRRVGRQTTPPDPEPKHVRDIRTGRVFHEVPMMGYSSATWSGSPEPAGDSDWPDPESAA